MQRFKEYLTEARARQMLYKGRLKGQPISFFYNLTQIVQEKLILIHPKWIEDIAMERYAYHVTDTNHLTNLLKMQGTANSISTTLGFRGYAYETGGNVQTLVRGKVNIVGSSSDIWSRIDYTSGARLIPFRGIVRDASVLRRIAYRFNSMLQEMQDKFQSAILSHLEVLETIEEIEKHLQEMKKHEEHIRMTAKENRTTTFDIYRDDLRANFRSIKSTLKTIQGIVVDNRPFDRIFFELQSLEMTVDTMSKNRGTFLLPYAPLLEKDTRKALEDAVKFQRHLIEKYKKSLKIPPDKYPDAQEIMRNYAEKCRKLVRYLVRRDFNPHAYEDVKESAETILSHIKVEAVVLTGHYESSIEKELNRLRIPYITTERYAKGETKDFLESHNKDLRKSFNEPIPI